jgi:replicative DNA helicase
MLCSEARIDSSLLRRMQLQRQDMTNLTVAADAISRAPMFIDDTPAPTVSELRSRCRRWRANKELFKDKPFGLVVIDYLQLMRGRDWVNSREQEISEISRGLKGLAKELRVPVIALSQLNRAVETRSAKDKRPQLSDLRESGAIEQDADVIQFIYRPEYYIAEKHSEDAQKLRGYAEILIAKQRNGPTGRISLTFIDEYTRFENRARDAWRDDE